MKLRSILAAALVAACTVQASGQEQNSATNPWFVQAGLGASYSVGGHAGLGYQLSPAGEIAVGKYFSPALGARIALGGWRGRVSHSGFYHGQATLDGLWNISQTVSRDAKRPVDLSLIVGIGFDRSYGHHASSFLGRAGLQMGVRLNDAFDFNVEAVAHGVSDRWNGLDDHSFDSYVNLLVGFSYKFGTGYKCPDCQPVVFDNERVNEMRQEVVREVIREVHDTVVVKEETPAEVRRGIRSHVTFALAKTNIEPSQEMNVKAVADYLNQNPDALAFVAGYADKGTGSEQINLRLARQRAEAVADMMVNKYGVSRDRLSITSMQDQNTEQPFQTNEWNRVVIMTAD